MLNTTININKKTIHILFILYFIVFFVNDLRIPLIKSSWTVPASIILVFFILSLLLLMNYKKFINHSFAIIRDKHNALNIYIYFVLYILLITLIYSILGWINFIESYAEILFTYIIAILSVFLINSYLISYKIKPYEILKIIYITFYAILCIGILDYIIYTYNIESLQKIHSLFFNIQSVAAGNQFAKALVNNSVRVQSVYFEPGIFAEYIFIFSPLIYHISLSRIKLLKNRRLNKFIKISYIPLMWINLILTQSPMGFVLTTISTIIFFKDKIKKLIIPIIAILSLIVIFINIVYPYINHKKANFFSRIESVSKNITNINMLILADPSLGTRISCVLNLIEIGIKNNPIFGIGHSNLKYYLINYIYKGGGKIIYTPEMYNCIILKEKPTFQNPPLSNMFVRYGIIGLILYYGFLFKIIFLLKRYSKFIKEPFLKNSYDCIRGSLCAILIISCYDLSIINLLIYSIIGIAIGFICYANSIKIFILKSLKENL